jgi:hypothetical protein
MYQQLRFHDSKIPSPIITHCVFGMTSIMPTEMFSCWHVYNKSRIRLCYIGVFPQFAVLRVLGVLGLCSSVLRVLAGVWGQMPPRT